MGGAMTKSAYRARWIIDGVSDSPVKDGTLLIEDGKVLEVGTRLGLSEDLPVVDLGEATLLPGLIDCHVHLPFDGSADPVASLAKHSVPVGTLMAFNHAQNILRQGVTTVRDVSAPHGISIGLRDAIEAGIVTGPRILASGTHICMTGGHGADFGIEVDGPDEVRKAVRQQLKAGADLIKVMETGGVYSFRQQPDSVQLFIDELRAAVEVARYAGRRVACHAEGAEGIRMAVEAGVTTIEHGNLLTPELADLMARKDVYLVPTIIAFKTVSQSPDLPPDWYSKGERMIQASYNCIKLAKEYGVKVAAGSDVGTCMHLPWDTHPLMQEIRLIAEAGGFSAMQVIKSATTVAATALGVEDMLGSLQAGKAADVVAVSGNVLEDLGRLDSPLLVLKGGEPAYQADSRQRAVV
jgi:imidazolonepropionase-like amidohydrolase